MIHHRERLPRGFEPRNDRLRVHAKFDHLQRHAAPDGLLLLRHPDDAAPTLADLLEQLVVARLRRAYGGQADVVARFFFLLRQAYGGHDGGQVCLGRAARRAASRARNAASPPHAPSRNAARSCAGRARAAAKSASSVRGEGFMAQERTDRRQADWANAERGPVGLKWCDWERPGHKKHSAVRQSGHRALENSSRSAANPRFSCAGNRSSGNFPAIPSSHPALCQIGGRKILE
jgi:hypothetical protein